MNNILKKYTIISLIFSIIILLVYPKYYFLIWNIFLAYIPFYLSFNFLKIKSKILKILNVFLGIIFYPNAIYVFTDLIHISNMKFYTKGSLKNAVYIMDFEQWIKLSLIFIAVIIAMKLSYYSIKNYASSYEKNRYYIYLFISFLTGIAVYIGRFIRLNSWNLVLNPINTLKLIFSQINIENMKYILLFTIIQIIIIIIEEEKI